MKRPLTHYAVSLASAAALGLLSFAATVHADSFGSTLSDPTTVSTLPISCPVWFACQYTYRGSQTSTPGGAGSYTMVDVLATAPYPQAANIFCLDLAPGSNIRLDFAPGWLLMAINGKFCGPYVSSNQVTFTGPYVIQDAAAPFKGATGGGTFTLAMGLADGSQSGMKLSGTINLPSGGGGGDPGPNPGSTPELDSLVLFGGGALALLGYVGMRWRSRRQRSA